MGVYAPLDPFNAVRDPVRASAVENLYRIQVRVGRHAHDAVGRGQGGLRETPLACVTQCDRGRIGDGKVAEEVIQQAEAEKPVAGVDRISVTSCYGTKGGAG